MTAAVQFERKEIPRGDAGTRATVMEMRRLIRQGSVLPIVRLTATDIVRVVAPRQYGQQINAIRRWCAEHIQFLRDPRGTELLHTAEWQLIEIDNRGRALVDCDDAAILTGALALAIGLKVRITTVAFLERSAPFAHTFAEVSSPIGDPQWVEMDVTRSQQAIDPSLFSRVYIVDV